MFWEQKGGPMSDEMLHSDALEILQANVLYMVHAIYTQLHQ